MCNYFCKCPKIITLTLFEIQLLCMSASHQNAWLNVCTLAVNVAGIECSSKAETEIYKTEKESTYRLI